MFNEIIKTIKTIVRNFIENEKLTEIQYGTVIQELPLHIQVAEKNTYKFEERDLVLAKSVLDYEVDVEVNHSTDSIYGAWNTSHSHSNAGISTIPIEHKHEYKGRKKIKIYNGLKKGEKVILLRVQGGQKFIVLDRLEPYKKVIGEWI